MNFPFYLTLTAGCVYVYMHSYRYIYMKTQDDGTLCNFTSGTNI